LSCSDDVRPRSRETLPARLTRRRRAETKTRSGAGWRARGTACEKRQACGWTDWKTVGSGRGQKHDEDNARDSEIARPDSWRGRHALVNVNVHRVAGADRRAGAAGGDLDGTGTQGGRCVAERAEDRGRRRRLRRRHDTVALQSFLGRGAGRGRSRTDLVRLAHADFVDFFVQFVGVKGPRGGVHPWVEPRHGVQRRRAQVQDGAGTGGAVSGNTDGRERT
jgi:hypothetical protein